MGREFELKYAADAEALAAIANQFGEFETISMETTYYDTPDGDLAARYITLRRRFENGRSVCTMKTPSGGLSRGEWEMECDSLEVAFPELCKLSNWEALLPFAASIAPVCGARFNRRAKTVSMPGFTAEIALDTGILLGGGKELPLCEVEVELKEGSEKAVTAFAVELARAYGLEPEHKSKFRRASNLAAGDASMD